MQASVYITQKDLNQLIEVLRLLSFVGMTRFERLSRSGDTTVTEGYARVINMILSPQLILKNTYHLDYEQVHALRVAFVLAVEERLHSILQAKTKVA